MLKIIFSQSVPIAESFENKLVILDFFVQLLGFRRLCQYIVSALRDAGDVRPNAYPSEAPIGRLGCDNLR